MNDMTGICLFDRNTLATQYREEVLRGENKQLVIGDHLCRVQLFTPFHKVPFKQAFIK